MAEDTHKFTMKWVSANDIPMEFSIYAKTKQHALEKALGNPITNIYLLDYLFQFEGNLFSVDHFLWLFTDFLEACYHRFAAEQCLGFQDCDINSSAKQYIDGGLG